MREHFIHICITHTQRLPKSAHREREIAAAAAEIATSCQELKAAAKRRVSRLTHYTFHCAIIPLKGTRGHETGRAGGGGGGDAGAGARGHRIELNWVS